MHTAPAGTRAARASRPVCAASRPRAAGGESTHTLAPQQQLGAARACSAPDGHRTRGVPAPRAPGQRRARASPSPPARERAGRNFTAGSRPDAQRPLPRTRAHGRHAADTQPARGRPSSPARARSAARARPPQVCSPPPRPARREDRARGGAEGRQEWRKCGKKQQPLHPRAEKWPGEAAGCGAANGPRRPREPLGAEADPSVGMELEEPLQVYWLCLCISVPVSGFLTVPGGGHPEKTAPEKCMSTSLYSA